MQLPTPKKLGKVLPSRSRRVQDEPEEEEEGFDLEGESESDNSDDDSSAASKDLLREMGITIESAPPEYVLTSGAIKGVSIRTYDVGGYVLEDVHQFHERVLQTVKWYGSALHQRDLDVHLLATELDKSQTDFMNQKFQMELLRGQTGKALVNEDGSYVTESQLQEDPAIALQIAQAKIVELTKHNEDSDNQVQSLTNSLNEFQTYAQQLEERQALLEEQLRAAQESTPVASQDDTVEPSSNTLTTSDEHKQLEELRTWAAEVEIAYTEMEQKVATLEALNATLKEQPQESAPVIDAEEMDSLRSKVEELAGQAEDSQRYATELEEFIQQLQNHISALDEYIAQMSTDVEPEEPSDASEGATNEEEEQQEEESARASSYAPELPEGVVLPSQQRRHRPSEFAPATPGAPLTSINPEDLQDYL